MWETCGLVVQLEVYHLMTDVIGIVVDGDGDFSSLKKRFNRGYKILKTDGPRGHLASVSDIARKSRKQIGILRAFKCVHAIVVLDLEQRNENYDTFLQALNDAFGNIDFGIPVSVAVANKMIENWYLADIEIISKNKNFLKDNLKQKNYEGTDGKKELKKCFKKRISYSETKHGPQLFEIIRFEVASQNSISFLNFIKLVDIN